MTGGRRNPILQQNQIEEAVEFVADFAEVPCALKSEAFEEAQGCGILRIHAGNHGVFARLPSLNDNSLEQ